MFYRLRDEFFIFWLNLASFTCCHFNADVDILSLYATYFAYRHSNFNRIIVLFKLALILLECFALDLVRIDL